MPPLIHVAGQHEVAEFKGDRVWPRWPGQAQRVARPGRNVLSRTCRHRRSDLPFRNDSRPRKTRTKKTTSDEEAPTNARTTCSKDPTDARPKAPTDLASRRRSRLCIRRMRFMRPATIRRHRSRAHFSAGIRASIAGFAPPCPAPSLSSPRSCCSSPPPAARRLPSRRHLGHGRAIPAGSRAFVRSWRGAGKAPRTKVEKPRSTTTPSPVEAPSRRRSAHGPAPP